LRVSLVVAGCGGLPVGSLQKSLHESVVLRLNSVARNSAKKHRSRKPQDERNRSWMTRSFNPNRRRERAEATAK
jgi:hypothetical protein